MNLIKQKELVPALCVLMGLVVTTCAERTSGTEHGKVIGWGAPANVVREANPAEPTGGDYYEVFQESLEKMPMILLIGLYCDIEVDEVLLKRGSVWWNGLLNVSGTINETQTDRLNLNSVEGISAMAISREASQRGDWSDAKTNPTALRRGESLAGFYQLTWDGTKKLPIGRYSLRLHMGEGAKDLFGRHAAMDTVVSFSVKAQGSDSRGAIEDLIERQYLWATWLYKFDRATSKRQFEEAWIHVQEYLRQGAGDEPALWNLTPRYQASRIAGWLDDKTNQIAYLSQLLSEDAGRELKGQECRMRYYHFHRDRGHLPRNVRDDLARGMNVLYERVQGKSMSGDPAPSAIAPHKNFP